MKINLIDKQINDISITIEGDLSKTETQKIISYINDYFDNETLIVEKDNEKVKINYHEIEFFYTDGTLLNVKTESGDYKIKYRIYELEQILPENTFIKINQGVIVNIRKIKSVAPCMNGTMKIEFIDGNVEYASRRSVRSIKEKLGI